MILVVRGQNIREVGKQENLFVQRRSLGMVGLIHNCCHRGNACNEICTLHIGWKGNDGCIILHRYFLQCCQQILSLLQGCHLVGKNGFNNMEVQDLWIRRTSWLPRTWSRKIWREGRGSLQPRHFQGGRAEWRALGEKGGVGNTTEMFEVRNFIDFSHLWATWAEG